MATDLPPRIVIGSGKFADGSEDTLIPSLVLGYSIRKYCPNAEIINTHELTKPRQMVRRDPTPFSLVRFWPPMMFNFHGWAIYLDADMLVFGDVREIWALRNPEKPPVIPTRKDNSVILMDCARLTDWDPWSIARQLDTRKLNYGFVQQKLCGKRRDDQVDFLPEEWNWLDNFRMSIPVEKAKLIHFSGLNTQPWKFPGVHKLEGIWAKALAEAVTAGAVSEGLLDGNCKQILEKVPWERKSPSSPASQARTAPTSPSPS